MVTEATRRAVWNDLLDVSRVARCAEAMGSQCRVRNLFIRLGLPESTDAEIRHRNGGTRPAVRAGDLAHGPTSAGEQESEAPSRFLLHADGRTKPIPPHPGPSPPHVRARAGPIGPIVPLSRRRGSSLA